MGLEGLTPDQGLSQAVGCWQEIQFIVRAVETVFSKLPAWGLVMVSPVPGIGDMRMRMRMRGPIVMMITRMTVAIPTPNHVVLGLEGNDNDHKYDSGGFPTGSCS
jgi:hypothetical protein